VALSLPTIVGTNGGTQVLEPDLSDDERRALERSATVLRDAIASATYD
jgi:L-lactate dehydrogenase